ncbi:tetratricopeptide repeat protein [Kordiimonas aestuarii]|uniref:tetratricopeptide repeat protein n=1 Tax=Kordiimonas aestuarii TaxID=1005925 RepID=UPI0021D39FD0|nr:hypothetical protein [Kordiimonas aestuarii]
MRICFCITGQVRGNLDNIRQLVPTLSAHDVSYIVQVWNKRGIAPSKNMIGRRRTSMADEIGLLAGPYAIEAGTIERVYALLEERHAKSGADTHVRPEEFAFLPAGKSHVDIKTLDELEANLPPQPIPIEETDNNIKMWYLIDKADQKRRELEENSGKAFDVVIRMRADTLFARNLDSVLERVADDLANGIVYTDSFWSDMFEGNRVYLVGDQVLIARPDVMDICTSYYHQWRLPRYLRKERSDAHYVLWRFLHGEKGLEIKGLPVVDRLTATSSRMALVSLAPHFDLGFAREQLAACPPQPDTPERDLGTLLAMNACIETTETRAELEALLDKVAAQPFHADSRFGASWLRAKVLRKLALPLKAFELYCAELTDIFNRGGERVFEDILLREGSFTLAEADNTSPERLRQMLADELWLAIGSILQSANQLEAATDMFQSCLQRGQHTVHLYERLVYGFVRLGQWQEALDHARACADGQVFSPHLKQLAERAATALGRPEEMSHFDEIAREQA